MGTRWSFPIQVRHRERRLIRADSPGFVVARQQLDDVLARQQRKARFVEERTSGELRGGFVGPPDVQLVADVLYGDPVIVLHLADEIDQRAGRAAPPGERQLTARDLHRDGDEILRGVQLEVVHFHGDRDVGDRVVQHQRFLELTLLVGRRELRELLVAEVALTVGELPERRVSKRHADAVKAAVVGGVGAVVAEHVVARHRLRRLRNAQREVVVIEHRMTARVLGERVQRVLRSLKRRQRVLRLLTVEHPDAARGRPRRVAERRLGYQASGVDGVQRHVGANGGVRRRAQLRLVVDAVETKPAGEIDERLLLRQTAQHRGCRLKCRQLTIRVQDAELRVVLAERGADVGVVGDAVAVLVVAEDQRLHDLAQRAPVAGEILLHPYRASAERHDRQQIRRLHLRIDERLRGGVRPHLIGGRHGGEVEVQDEKAPIPIAGVAWRRNGDLSLRRGRCTDVGWSARRGLSRARVRRPIGKALEFDEADRLRLAVLGDDEVVRRQSFNRPAIPVLDAHGLDDEAGTAAEYGRRLL